MSDSRVGTFLAPTSPQSITFDTGLGVTPTGLIVFTGPPDAVNTIHDGLDCGIGFCDGALNQIAGGGVDPWTNNLNDVGAHYYVTGNYAQTVGARDGHIVDIAIFERVVDVVRTEILIGAVTALNSDGTIDINFTVATDAVARTLGFIAFAGVNTKVGRVTWPGSNVKTALPFAPATVLLYGWQSAAWQQTLIAVSNLGNFALANPDQPLQVGAPGTAGVGGSILVAGHGIPSIHNHVISTHGPAMPVPLNNATNPGYGSTYGIYLSDPPTLRAVGAIASGVGTISPGLPTGTVAGDLLIMFLETANQAITVAGWTQAPSSPQSDATDATRLTVFYKIAVGADATTTSDSGNHQIGRIIGIKKDTFDPANPLNASAGASDPVSSTSATIPGATTTVPNCMILAAVCSGNHPGINGTGNFGFWSNPDMFLTERIDNVRTDGNGGGIGVATGQATAAGAYPASTVTLGVATRKGMISLAVAPNPSGSFTLVKLTTAGDDYPPPIPFGYMAIGTEDLAQAHIESGNSTTFTAYGANVTARHIIGASGKDVFFLGGDSVTNVNFSLSDVHGNSVALWLGGIQRSNDNVGEWGCGIFDDRVVELGHATLFRPNDLRNGIISDGSGNGRAEYSYATLDTTDPDCLTRTWHPDTFQLSADDYSASGDLLDLVNLEIIGPSGGGCPPHPQSLAQIWRYR